MNCIKRGIIGLFKRPIVAIVSILSLGIVLGINIAIFSIINVVLLRSLPFDDADSLVMIYHTNPSVPKYPVSYPDYDDWNRMNSTFESLGAFSFRDDSKVMLLNEGNPIEVQPAYISDNLFDTMKITLQRGRDFIPPDQLTSTDQVVILSHHMWNHEYGLSEAIIGEYIEIDEGMFLVAGIANPHQEFPSDADLWLPLSRMPKKDLVGREKKRLWVVGRLKATVTRHQSEIDLRSIMAILINEYPRITNDESVTVTSLIDYIAGDVRSTLFLLVLAGNLILMITCSNITSFLLARASDRRLEVAIRSAVGAPRGAIAKEFIIESVLLSSIAFFLGVVMSLFICNVVEESAEINIIFPRIDQLSLDTTVASYAGVITILSTVVFGVWSSVKGSRSDLRETLKGEASPVGTTARNRTHSFLIVCEVAISIIVLVAATTLLASLWKLRATDLGFRSERVLAVELSLSPRRYPTGSDISAFYGQLLPRLRSLSGIEEVSATNVLPLDQSLAMMHYGIDGTPIEPKDRYPVAQIRIVAPGYFKLLRIPVTKGRFFADSDARRGARPVYIVNEALVQAHFRQEDPLAKLLEVVEAPVPFRVPIVGVVADVRDVAMDQQAAPTIYSVGFARQGTVLVRANSEPLALVDLIQREMQAVDEYQPLGSISKMDELVENSLSQRELLTGTMGAFSLIALILSSLGIYGVVAYSVAGRKSEIALRMALGADKWAILKLLVLRGMRPVTAGILIGVAATGSQSNALYGLLDNEFLPVLKVYTFAIGCTLSVSLLAIIVPAIQAAVMNPRTAIRSASEF